MVGSPGQEEAVTVFRQLQAFAAVTAVQGVVRAASANERHVNKLSEGFVLYQELYLCLYHELHFCQYQDLNVCVYLELYLCLYVCTVTCICVSTRICICVCA